MKCVCLVGWKQRRADASTERHWAQKASEAPLSTYQQHQQNYNFKETDYGERPSNNGLDLANPSFAFTTDLAKYIEVRDVV